MKKYIVVFVCTIFAVVGCGKSDKSLSTIAGERVGEEVTKIVTGIDSGVDKQLSVDVTLSARVTDSGLSKTVAKSSGLSTEKGFNVYFISKKKISGILTAKAFNKDNQEIGRTKTEVSFNSDDAKYINFVFDNELDTTAVKNYEIDFSK